MPTIAARSDYDLTGSLSIRRGETWMCQMGVEPNSIIYCQLGTDRRYSRTMTFPDRNGRTCVLIEASDYQPSSSVRPNESGYPVDIWAFTEITLPRDAAFALTCVGAGRDPPTPPWRCLYPADYSEATDSIRYGSTSTPNTISLSIDPSLTLSSVSQSRATRRDGAILERVDVILCLREVRM